METVLILSAILGVAFVIFMARKLTHIQELFFFGGVFGLAEFYRYWGAEYLGFPQLPLLIMVFIAGGFGFWSLLKIIYVLGLFLPPIKIVPQIFLGK